jgi:hypothetical protein
VFTLFLPEPLHIERKVLKGALRQALGSIIFGFGVVGNTKMRGIERYTTILELSIAEINASPAEGKEQEELFDSHAYIKRPSLAIAAVQALSYLSAVVRAIKHHHA